MKDLKLKMRNLYTLFIIELIKRDLKTRPIYDCRCEERLEPKGDESTCLAFTGLLEELEYRKQGKKTWLLGEFEGRWSTRRQGGEWGTDAWNGARTGVSERLPSQPRGNVSTVRMDTSVCRCRSDVLRSTGAR
jgi:hypothetical protein